MGQELSGVGLYSRQMLAGLAALAPGVRFDFCCRTHRYFRTGDLPQASNARLRIAELNQCHY